MAEDIGTALETGAYLTALRRIVSGQFSLQQAHTFEQLENMTPTERQQALLPLGYGLQDMPSVQLSHDQLIEIQNGRDISLPADETKTAFTSASTGKQELLTWSNPQKTELVAILEQRENGLWKPRKVFVGA
ncbi:hypothetical protein LRY65_02340 [Candidatus Woesebacteria bacterium]|nr:hypothetical protein [Candidatus Woesebacteria bacterium]